LHIIPVIDLLNGVVVHAKKGARAQYQPIQSSLTDTSHPLDIVKAFLTLYPFKTLYIADLNAIQNLPNTGQCHHQIIEAIHQQFPQLTLWIDAGINNIETAEKWVKPYTQLVLGSESFSSLEQYQLLSNKLTMPFTLSLDFLPQGYAGAEALLQKSQYWPNDVIVMTLAQVGANTGVHTPTIHDVLLTASNQNIYAAGGIRDINDLAALKQLNIKGALVASALHNKQLASRDLTSLNHNNAH